MSVLYSFSIGSQILSLTLKSIALDLQKNASVYSCVTVISAPFNDCHHVAQFWHRSRTQNIYHSHHLDPWLSEPEISIWPKHWRIPHGTRPLPVSNTALLPSFYCYQSLLNITTRNITVPTPPNWSASRIPVLPHRIVGPHAICHISHWQSRSMGVTCLLTHWSRCTSQHWTQTLIIRPQQTTRSLVIKSFAQCH